jgi:hypothetical protein
MKRFITCAVLMLATLGALHAQTTATNWTAVDCNSNSHTLFTDLNNGKIVVMVWVMPCGSCVNGAKAAYNAAQSFATSHPGKVVYYIADDLGDATCTDLNTWITTNSIGTLSNMSVFGNAGNVINENDFGGTGMPHVVVMGGTDHKIYYNKKNSATNDLAGITGAISYGISVTSGVESINSAVSFSVSPNPAKDVISITYKTAIKTIRILNTAGQVVKEESFSKGKTNPAINMSGIAAGVYTIKLTDMSGLTGQQRIVKE